MKISLNWLGDFITWKETDPHEIARRITAHVAEVDAVEIQGKLLNGVCVGKILSVGKHPNADKLSLCEVQTDKGTKKVVCGGTNLRLGMRIAFAHIGTTVQGHDGELFTLESVKIRGEQSDGMICASEEIGLADLYPPTPEQGNRPILDLGDGNDGVTVALGEYLGMNDVVLHIDNHAITHRADLFSHVGFARECVAIGLGSWQKKLPDYAAPKFTKEKIPFKFIVDSPKLMPRYCACMISIDSLGETPAWMKKRLQAVGWRPISLPIDITNYVASEVGVPLHSFDSSDIKGDVHMRTAKEGEKIVTLDEKERTLPAGAMVLSDDLGIFDLLGIMGGLRSSTKDTTRTIYLHSASVDPVSIRRTVIATGHRTDAATVYEKGVPHVTAEAGFNRAARLFLELVPGARISSALSEKGDNGKAPKITLSVKRVQSVLGAKIPAAKMKKILQDLKFTVTGSGDKLSVTPPLTRLGDIEGEHDLIEEIGRIYGYNEIEATLPSASIQPPQRDQRIHQIREVLKEHAFVEILPLSFIGPDLLKKTEMDPAKAVGVENALGEELSLMAPSTLPRLLEHATPALLQSSTALKTFTWQHVFHGFEDEHLELGLFVAAKSDPSITQEPFLVASQAFQNALKAAGYAVQLKDTSSVASFMHAGRTAEVQVNGKVIGHVFELTPAIRSRFDLTARAAAVTLNLSLLFKENPDTVIAKSLPLYPAVSYDITVTMDHQRKAATLIHSIQKSSPLLEKVEVADLYNRPGEKSYKLTLRCTYRSPERTLTEEEVKLEHAKIEKLALAS